jgi:hypothetical protein
MDKEEERAAANRRRQRVAPLTDRASMDKDERERGSVCPYSAAAPLIGIHVTDFGRVESDLFIQTFHTVCKNLAQTAVHAGH